MNRKIRKYSDYKKIAVEQSKKYIDTPGLIGIIWIGSAAYGINDKDIDLDIHLVCSSVEKSYTMKQYETNQIKIELDKIDAKRLLQKTGPDSEEFWIREKSVILYDPKNILKKTFKKLNHISSGTYHKLLKESYKNLFHSYNFEKSVRRNETITASMYVMQTINTLSKFCFLYHEKPVPTFKWRWHYVETENLLKKNIIEKIKLFNSRKTSDNLRLLKLIESNAAKMMREKGFSVDFVNQPWLF